MTDNLPAHSSLGASSAERWMNCPGSVHLIRTLSHSADKEDPDYRRDGTEAHALAAYCLDNNLDAWEMLDPMQAHTAFLDITGEMVDAVQVYLDYVRKLPGEHSWELKLARPELHELAYGTLDFCAVPRVLGTGIEFVDYKNGVGVVVEATDNVQLQYYAYLKLGDDANFDDAERVRLTIVQPRGFHRDGPIRSWDTTVGAIRRFAHDELRPGMERALSAHDIFLDMGSWCRFCPAKLICPAMATLADAAVAVKTAPAEWASDETVGQWFERTEQLKMLIKAVETEAQRRMLEGHLIPGAKLVHGLVDRVFKPDAPVEKTFGADAFEPAKLRSVAQVEKLPGGAEFVKEWGFKPEGAPKIALASDKRVAIKVEPTEKKFQKYLDSVGASE